MRGGIFVAGETMRQKCGVLHVASVLAGDRFSETAAYDDGQASD